MDVQTDPPQPDEVERAVASALEQQPLGPDPWWQAGIEEALGT